MSIKRKNTGKNNNNWNLDLLDLFLFVGGKNIEKYTNQVRNFIMPRDEHEPISNEDLEKFAKLLNMDFELFIKEITNSWTYKVK